LCVAFVERKELLRKIQADRKGEGPKAFPTSATECE
jgi:hypothetical protein